MVRGDYFHTLRLQDGDGPLDVKRFVGRISLPGGKFVEIGKSFLVSGGKIPLGTLKVYTAKTPEGRYLEFEQIKITPESPVELVCGIKSQLGFGYTGRVVNAQTKQQVEAANAQNKQSELQIEFAKVQLQQQQFEREGNAKFNVEAAKINQGQQKIDQEQQKIDLSAQDQRFNQIAETQKAQQEVSAAILAELKTNAEVFKIIREGMGADVFTGPGIVKAGIKQAQVIQESQEDAVAPDIDEIVE